MNNNPLPNNRGDHVNMITIDEEYNLEETVVLVADKEKVERLKLARALMMVAMEMLKNGFVPSQGLGVHLDGILKPIQLFEYKSTFGLGYETSLKEVSSANLKRKGDILLPKLIQLLNQSVFKMFVAQVSEEDTEEVLIEGVKTLFITEEKNECNMILEDCIETLTIWDAKPRDDLKN
ncbi:hypothetical protein BC332_23832 [Capsicum chinense]|nr:hypothetical protein BC332_23832 [Capsicum chinense]